MSRNAWVLVLLFLGWSLCCPSQAVAQEDGDDDDGGGWSLQHMNRRKLIIYRLKQMLQRDPFSKYAMRRLLALHTRRADQNKLIDAYRRLVRNKPKDYASKAILARIYETEQTWDKALALYRDIRQGKPKWFEPTLAIARCLHALGRHKEATLYYQKGIASIRGPRREAILQKLLRAALKAKNKAAKTFALKELRKRAFSPDQALLLARLLLEHKQWKEGIPLLEGTLKTTQGSTRVRRLLELSRAETKAGRFDKALSRIDAARKMKTLFQWFYWEMQMQEVEIYRQQKRLDVLIARLRKKWKGKPHTKNFRKVFLLASLYAERKELNEAIPFFVRATKLKPDEREPRIPLIAWYMKNNQLDKAHHQMRMLIKHDVADAKHYFYLAHYHLQLSQRYTLERWHPSWRQRYRCKKKRKKRTFGTSAFPWKSTPTRYKRKSSYYRRRRRLRIFRARRCSPKQWSHHRRRLWRFWQRYLAEKNANTHTQKALDLLSKCARRFSDSWEIAKQLEEILDRYGFIDRAQKAFRRLLKLTSADLGQLKTIHEFLYNTGRLPVFRALLVRILNASHPILQRGVSIAAFAFRPPLLYPSGESDEQLRTKRARWKARICPRIVRFLRRMNKGLPHEYARREPTIALEYGILLRQCGHREARLPAFLTTIEQRLMESNEGLRAMLKLYIHYKFTKAFDRVIKHPRFRQHPTQLLAFLRPLFKNRSPLTQINFLLKRLRLSIDRKSPLMVQTIEMLCRQKRLCRRIKPQLTAMVSSTEVPVGYVLRSILAAHRRKLFLDKHEEWLKSLVKRHRHNVSSLQKLAEAHALFMHKDDLRRIHRELLGRILSKRQTAPFNLYLWGSMLQAHLKKIYPTSRENRREIEKIDKAARRFPHLYRQVLALYMTNYSYRKKYGRKKFKQWLQSDARIHDFLLLRSYYYRLPTDKEKWLRQVASKMKRPELLNAMALFAQEKGMVGLHVDALKRLYKLQPHSISLLKRIVDLLDRLPNHRDEADFYAIEWLKLRPRWTTLKNIARFTTSCCSDRSARHMARRLLVRGLRLHPLSKMWPLLQQTFPKLNAKQQRLLLSDLHSQYPQLKLSQLEQLITLLEKSSDKGLQTRLLTDLIRRGKGQRKHLRRLAELLDRDGHLLKAMKTWRAYFKRSKIKQPQAFFSKLAKQYLVSGEVNLAKIAMFRSLRAQKVLDPDEVRYKVEQALERGQEHRAWAHWLWLQKDKASSCLRHMTGSFAHKPHVQLLALRLNAPLRGPFAFFPKCQWALPESVRYQVIPALVRYLKLHPHHSIQIIGGADAKDEPDAAFLAKQRALSIRRLLVSQRISPKRISLDTFETKQLCGRYERRSRKKKNLTCGQFRRQVAIFIKVPRKTKAVLTRARTKPPITTLRQYLAADLDDDLVPDYLDNCPLRSARGYSRYRRYRSRRRRRYRRYNPSKQTHPYKGLYPYYSSYRRRNYLRKKSTLRGCNASRYYGQLYIKGIKGDLLRTQHITFYTRSSNPRSASYRVLQQISAFMRLVPKLGRLQIEVFIAEEKARRRRYYRSRRYYKTPEKRAQERGEKLVSHLKRKGVPRSRIVLRIRQPNKAFKSQWSTPLVVLRFIDLKLPKFYQKKKKKKKKGSAPAWTLP